MVRVVVFTVFRQPTVQTSLVATHSWRQLAPPTNLRLGVDVVRSYLLEVHGGSKTTQKVVFLGAALGDASLCRTESRNGVHNIGVSAGAIANVVKRTSLYGHV